MALAQSPLEISMMPSYSQNPTYGNAAINVPIQVWGKVTGGSGTYGNYTIDFGDGSAPFAGTVNNADTTFGVGSKDFLMASHTFTSGGSKTVTLTVTDSNNITSSRSAVIRVMVAPTHDEKVNMAIEKGLIYLYRAQIRYGTPLRSYWYQNNQQYGNGTTGASVMAFAENGHLATNDPVADIYAETVKRGIYHIVSLGRQQAIGVQADGNPDTNGNSRGINFSPNFVVYDHGFMLMGVINAFADDASALATPIPAGLWV